MSERLETDVLVVGAGPVGLVLAMHLARRGIRVTMLETRHRGEPPSVKCNHVAARSMEIFRRLGIVKAVRDAGLPPDYPNDIAYRTTMLGRAIARIPIPCRRDRYVATEGPDTHWPTPEPPHRINQLFLEPILFEHAAAMPTLTILNRSEYEGYQETGDGIVARARNLDNGARLTIAARYLAGCDGGRSQVRRDIGARLVGDAVVQRVQSTMSARRSCSRACRTSRLGNLAQPTPQRKRLRDRRPRDLVHTICDDEPDFKAWIATGRSGRSSASASAFYDPLKRGLVRRRLVADRFRLGRVFAGTPHICGCLMRDTRVNAGIADAEGLAGSLRRGLPVGGTDGILDAYTAGPANHRRGLGLRHEPCPCHGEGAAAFRPRSRRRRPPAMRRAGRLVDRSTTRQRPAALLRRVEFRLLLRRLADHSPTTARRIRLLDGRLHALHGFRAADGTSRLADSCRSLCSTQSAPAIHVRFDQAAGPAPLLDAARRRGVPVRLFDVQINSGGRAAYSESFVLSRPDCHVAWRDDRVPDDPVALIDTIRGAGAPAQSGRSG